MPDYLYKLNDLPTNIFCHENVICLLQLLYNIQVLFRLDIMIEANTMNPDQTAPK